MTLLSLWNAIRAKLFPKVHSYAFKKNVLPVMRSMAFQTHPKEAFGVLRGRHKGRTLVVRDIAYQPFLNTPMNAHIALDPYVLPDMVGTFHSHPSTNPLPSAADKRLFAKHPGVHCIIAYPYKTVHVYNSSGEPIGLHKL